MKPYWSFGVVGGYVRWGSNNVGTPSGMRVVGAVKFFVVGGLVALCCVSVGRVLECRVLGLRFSRDSEPKVSSDQM